MESLVLFVYGTLKRGERAHGLLEGAEFLRLARSAPTYTLVTLGPYPALLEGGTTAVTGELYRIPASALPRLDDYEDCPALYSRKPVDLEDGTRAITYLGPEHWRERFPTLTSGVFEDSS